MVAAQPFSKAECLKRYLPAPVDTGSKASLTRYKKLRKVTGAGGKGMRVVDDDVSWADISAKSKKEEKEDEGDLPVVAEFIDERPEEVKQMEAFHTGSKWKLLGEQKSDLSPPRRTRHDSPDSSPPRRTWQDSSDPLQPRRFPFNLPDLAPEVCHSLFGKAPAKSPLGLKKSSTHGDESSQHKNRSPSSPGPGEPLPDSRRSSLSHRKFHWKPSTKKLQRHHVDSSLLGKSNHQASDSDLTPPLKKQKADSNSDLSPPRRKQKNRSGDSDPSPPQRSQPPVAKATHLLSGIKTGLVSYVRRDQHELSKQDQEIKHLEVEFQNTDTIFQDKSGCKRDQKLDQLEQHHKERSEKNEQYAQWGKGLAQSQQQQQNVEDAIREMQKPFSWYINDEDIDQMLREQEREGDLMAKFIKKNKVKRNKDKKEKPGYSGPAPPLNRFNICPGYHWDGVDRSNGFEEKRFIRLANKKAVEELAYKWSTEDM